MDEQDATPKDGENNSQEHDQAKNIPSKHAVDPLIPKVYGGSVYSGVSPLMKAYKNGDIGAYGSDPEERRKSREFWEAIADDARKRNDVRDMQRASYILNKFAEYDLKLLEMVDKAHRLDEGSATETYTFGAVEFRGGRKVKDD